MSHPEPKYLSADDEISAVLRRAGQAGEVAASAAWLCPDHASFIIGATIADRRRQTPRRHSVVTAPHGRSS